MMTNVPPMLRKKLYLAILFCWLLFAAGCTEVVHEISGQTMGTTYHIKAATPRFHHMDAVRSDITALLEDINQSMSTYRRGSEINLFNAFQKIRTAFPISAHFLRVMLTAQEIYHLTAGAWDGTVNPLVNLWGFGQEGSPSHLPEDHQISQALETVGFSRITVDVNGFLSKAINAVTLDLASIAKGYAVDQVALLLRGRGLNNFIVEIGGEVYAAGRRPDGKLWRVGINRPDRTAPFDAVYATVSLEDQALATSGDYRNFRQIDGKFFSHIIDPRTGRPVQNGVVSASVVADNCALADGLATALMVMGLQEGMALLNRLPGVDGLIVIRHADGRLEDFWSRPKNEPSPQKAH